MVATKGCSLSVPTRNPLIAPSRKPMARQTITQTGIGSPAFASCAPMQATNASAEPTDKSMPPVMITQVIPMPIRPYVTA